LTEIDFTHLDSDGKIKMVDITNKQVTLRTAEASGEIIVSKEIFEKILKKQVSKGDVITTAKIAAISGAKKTSDLIPLCHQIKLTAIDVEFDFKEGKDSFDFNEQSSNSDQIMNKIVVNASVSGEDKTGVEMEALTAVSIALLTIYDMCKALSKDMVIGNIRLIKKTGGKSNFNKEAKVGQKDKTK